MPGHPLAKWCVPTIRRARPTATRQQRPEQRAPAPADECCQHQGEDRCGGGQEQRGHEHHRHRHDDHGQLGGYGVGAGPLPADRQLGPQGQGQDEEAGDGGAERDEAPTGLVATIERLAGQPGDGETGDEAATGDIEDAPRRVGSLLDLGQEELGELLAVAGPPLAGIAGRRAERRDDAAFDSWSVTPPPTSPPAGADRARRCRVG